jgi:hypothetical protein
MHFVQKLGWEIDQAKMFVSLSESTPIIQFACILSFSWERQALSS